VYRISVDLPNLGKGQTVEIDGLGIFTNGSEGEVTEEQAEAFRVKHQVAKSETDAEGNMHTEVTLGPTVLQAFKGNKYITVARASDKQQQELPFKEGDKQNA
jgi:hypothetical protein